MRTSYPGGGAVNLAFPTPLLRKLIPDADETNAALRALALEREKAGPSVGRSNVGGWHSADDVFEWPSPAIATFRGWVADGIREITQFALAGELDKTVDIEMGGAAWINLCRDGGYNKIHNHPDCSWSGVYYVSLGEPDAAAPPDAGRIEFLDPRMGATDIGLRGVDALPKLTVDPQPGLMVIFPAWLYHYVNPFRGAGERISIAFNISLTFSVQTAERRSPP